MRTWWLAQAESLELTGIEGIPYQLMLSRICKLHQKSFSRAERVDLSHNLSPMAAISRYIQETNANAKIVFESALVRQRKPRIQQDFVKPWVRCRYRIQRNCRRFATAKNIDLLQLLRRACCDNASYFGRIFAHCGGLADAVAQGLKEQGFEDFELKACSCDGIEACRTALMKKKRGILDANFIEGMR